MVALDVGKILDTIEDAVDIMNKIKSIANKHKLRNRAKSESTHPAQSVKAGEDYKVVQFPIKNKNEIAAWLQKFPRGRH